eukprot:1317728-Rhodomonas_salina.5
MWGTDITCPQSVHGCREAREQQAGPIVLCACYAMSGTDAESVLASYVLAMRCPVLTYGMPTRTMMRTEQAS